MSDLCLLNRLMDMSQTTFGMEITVKSVEMVVDYDLVGYEWEANLIPQLIEEVHDGHSSKVLVRSIWLAKHRSIDAIEAANLASRQLPFVPFSWEDENQWVESILELKDLVRAKPQDPWDCHTVFMRFTDMNAQVIADALSYEHGYTQVMELPDWRPMIKG